jgi:hypothetical protein
LSDCVVHPPVGVPSLEKEHLLPKDVEEFYKICGGLDLFIHSSYPIYLVPPSQFILANPIIIGERYEEDITADWYIFAHDGNGDYLTIDLNKKRLGRCYDSFHDRHGVVGDCPIIGTSFTDTLKRLISNRGDYWYWLKDDFVSLGDAYDNN